jgi:tRNA(Met) cytidine acetyltransferase
MEGTVAKAGLLIIVCPDFTEWPNIEATNPGINFNYHSQHSQSLFLVRMLKILLCDKTNAFLTPESCHLPLAIANKHQEARISKTGLSMEQQGAFDDLSINLNKQGTIALIKAKRGRGKSTLLGHLAAEFAISNSERHVYITAPHVNNAQRAQSEYRNIMKIRHGVISHLNYIAPDQLFSLPKNALLLIDEAAAIAPSILLYACDNFDNSILATTIAGYEGSGLGFKLRVLPKLETLNKKISKHELNVPLRWFEEDSLEQTFAKIFAPYPVDETEGLNIRAPTYAKALESKQNIELNFIKIDKDFLIEHENLLAQVFGLLTQSHYQTAPDDLMRILDADDIEIVALSNTKDLDSDLCSIDAVAIISHEGGLNTPRDLALLEAISSSQRRVNGHLVAQNLLTTLCNNWFMGSKSWRINRIAVKPKYRRLGLGQKLLQEIKLLAEQKGLEFLSTSFGLTRELYRFWQSQDYVLTKIGARRDTSSGEHSAMMISPISETAAQIFASYSDVIRNDLNYFFNYLFEQTHEPNELNYIKDHLQELVKRSFQNKVNDSNDNSEAFDSALDLKSQTITKATQARRIKQFLSGKRSLTNAAASIFYYTVMNEGNAPIALHEAFNKAHQKFLSKEAKLENIEALKASLETLVD